MNWIKENKSLAAVFGVMIVGALAIGAWLFMAYSAYTAKREEWDTATAEIKRLETEKLYPNAANSTEKERLVTEYAQNVNLLRSALLDPSVQEQVKPLSETEFQALLKERVNAVRAAATDKMSLPAEFALGFDDYTGSLPRSAEVAADLGLHLDVMEKLLNVLITSGVKSLDGFERSALPTEKAEVEAKAAAVKPNSNKNKNKKALISEAAAAEPVLDRYTVKLFLTADQAPFQAVMNTLSDPAKMPHFVVVRLLRAENEKSEGPVKSEVRSQGAEASTASTEPSAASTTDVSAIRAIVPPKPLPADAVTIMGDEKLKVYLEIDYVRFRPAATEGASDNSAAAAVNP